MTSNSLRGHGGQKLVCKIFKIEWPQLASEAVEVKNEFVKPLSWMISNSLRGHEVQKWVYKTFKLNDLNQPLRP